jgi:hypothetical protein
MHRLPVARWRRAKTAEIRAWAKEQEKAKSEADS